MELLVPFRSPVRPGRSALTFQLALQSAGNFFFFMFFSGAGIFDPLVERNSPSFKHPMKQAGRDGTASFWQGAAQV